MRELGERRGIRTRGMSANQLYAMFSSMGTSDFQHLLANVANKVLRAVHDKPTSGARELASPSTIVDFKPKSVVAMGELPVPELVREGGEFTHGSIAEAKEGYQLATYGKIVSLTRQAIVNDDLTAFNGIVQGFAMASLELEIRKIVELIESNPLMQDGIAVFAAGHSNLTTPGTALTVDNVSLARVAMRKQVGVDGSTLISVDPKVILVAPEAETAAQRVVAAINPLEPEAANPFAGALRVIVEPRLTNASRWYLVDDNAPGLEFSYLSDAPGPQVESRVGFEVDAVQFRLRLDWGGGWTDWRGWHRNGA